MSMSSQQPTREDDPRLAAFRLPAHTERLDRPTCLRVCENFFRLEIEEQRLPDDATTTTTTTIAALLTNMKKLCYKLENEHDSLYDPIRVTVRSVPIRMYGNLLRHYYVRIEDVLDIHPGTKHRLAPAWWHNTTKLETDALERELALCGECCDEFLDYVWHASESFNIIWNNCDIVLNRCEQSFAIGVLAIQLLWYLSFGDICGLLSIGLATLVFLGLRFYANTRTANAWRCDRFYSCAHVLLEQENLQHGGVDVAE